MALRPSEIRTALVTGLGVHLLGSAFYLQALTFSRFWQTAVVFAVSGLLLAVAHREQPRRRRLHAALRERGIPSAPISTAAYLALLCLAALMIALPTALWLTMQGVPERLDFWLGVGWLCWTALAGLLSWLRWKEAQMLERGARAL